MSELIKSTRDPRACREIEDLAFLYAAGELLNARDRAAVEEHVRDCAPCAAVLESEMAFHQRLAETREAADRLDCSGLLLARCRRELAQALDDEPNTSRNAGSQNPFSPGYWAASMRHAFVFRPGWSTAALLLAGILLGSWGRAWYRQQALTQPPAAPAMVISATPPLNQQDLATLGIEAIRTEQPGGIAAPKVELRLRANRPMVLEGSVDDPEIQRVLAYVVQHGEQFDPDVRLSSVDVLRARAGDPQIRDALCSAAQRDPNSAVRLKAFQALSGLGADPTVQQALLRALADDGNAGVRVEAANQLLAAVGDSRHGPLALDDDALTILRDRMQHDPNENVRMSSAAVLTHAVAAEDSGDAQRVTVPGSPQP